MEGQKENATTQKKAVTQGCCNDKPSSVHFRSLPRCQEWMDSYVACSVRLFNQPGSHWICIDIADKYHYCTEFVKEIEK